MNNNYNNDRRSTQGGSGRPHGSGQPQNQNCVPQAQYRPVLQNNGQYQYQRAPQQNNSVRRQMPGNNVQRPQTPNGSTVYPPVRHKSRAQAKKAAGMVVLMAVILGMLLISVIIFAARCASGIGGAPADGTEDNVTDTPVSDTPSSGAIATDTVPADTAPAVTEPPAPAVDASYDYVEKTAADVHRGYQILVNYQNAYSFDGGFTLETLYSAKNGNYKVNNITDSIDRRALRDFSAMMTALSQNYVDIDGQNMQMNDIIITSADRTFEDQEAIYADYADRLGDEYARQYVAVPGHSEHHAGLALDLSIYTDGGRSYSFDSVPEYPEWLRANAHKYGFIERYQADKTAITKIAYENWHYRYIGKPHAFYIKSGNLCLEEYIDFVRGFEFGKKHLAITDDEGASWEIYFVPANESGVTSVPVPKLSEYEVSGNNVDGFIVTVKK